MLIALEERDLIRRGGTVADGMSATADAPLQQRRRSELRGDLTASGDSNRQYRAAARPLSAASEENNGTDGRLIVFFPAQRASIETM